MKTGNNIFLLISKVVITFFSILRSGNNTLLIIETVDRDFLLIFNLINTKAIFFFDIES